MSTSVAATFPRVSWLTNISFINPLQFQGVIFSRFETAHWKFDHAMLEPFCALTVSFLHFCQSSQSLGTLNYINGLMMSGASPLLDMTCHWLLWCVMLFNSFLSEPVPECLVWIWEVQPAHTNTSIYVCVQNYNISGNWEKTTSCIYLSISYPFLIVSFFNFNFSYISFVPQCLLIHKIKLMWSTAVDFVCVNQMNWIFAC